MDFKSLLKNEFVFLDGAMGTMIQKSGVLACHNPETLCIENPDLIKSIHKKYIDAGSNIIYTNTFGANSYKLKNSKYTVDEVVKSAIKCAKDASISTQTLVALDIGPIGKIMEPAGDLSFNEAYNIFKEIIISGKDADVIVIETMTDLLEAKAAVLAAKENSNLPILCSMSFEENLRTFSGTTVSSMILTLGGLGVDGIGFNCSLGPKEFKKLLNEAKNLTDIPLIAKANAGLPDPITNEYTLTAKEFAKEISGCIEYGIKFVGGCCGTDDNFIKEIINEFKDKKFVKNDVKTPCAVCSSTKTVVIDKPTIIGERINPTGKKRFKEALINKDFDYIVSQATSQMRAGASILDINVGLPQIDEKQMLSDVVKKVGAICDLPLQIDSSNAEAIELAIREYPGRPIINSVNGDDEVLDKILPIVKKYNAMVIGLTLDKNGIPKTCKERIKIAQKIINKAKSYDIDETNLIIDCLTLTASVEQDAVMETLSAIKEIKSKYNVKTVLGVSNISFGLPNRDHVNQTFLTMALCYGLDLAIINPNVNEMAKTIYSFNLLSNIDKNSVDYIKFVSDKDDFSASATLQSDNYTLEYCIENGLKTQSRQITKELLKTKDSIYIIDNILIPTLDKIGIKFEKGEIFLPTLILSSDVAKESFDIINESIEKSDKKSNKVVLATVKGDIHDIGKNIVKSLLENYGFDVIDLGKDVDPEVIIDAVIKNDVKLLGLSALMTTTLNSMKKTIELLHEKNIDCKVMVGGAVVNKEFADSINADYYAKSAKNSVDYAKKVFKKN